MTLLEMTVILAVLLSLCSLLFISARTWKSGADRAGCVLQIRNIQLAVRSYQNMYGYVPGGAPHAQDGSQDIGNHLLGAGYISTAMNEAIHGRLTCPGEGTYSCDNRNLFPLSGSLYVSCSLASGMRHQPDSSADW